MEKAAGFVAIVGRPNVGKSTLLNLVMESELSIVTNKAQTTRERVLGILTEPRGQMIFIDTPGIHKAKPGGVNEYMVGEATAALEGASAVWYLVDPASAMKHEEVVLERLARVRDPIFIVMTKQDLLGARERGPAFGEELKAFLEARGQKVSKIALVSGKKGTGVKELVDATWAQMPWGPAYYPDAEQLSDRPVRFFVGEMVREQLYLHLGEELPYSCAVEVTRFDERVNPKRIEATIHVERDSQKGMVIGKGATKLKEIGRAARGKIEKFMGERVFLGLKVEVLKEWTRERRALEKLGYHVEQKSRRGAK